MKIRNGFVSNSSSSSFIIELSKDISEYSLGEFQELIGHSCKKSEILFKDLNYYKDKLVNKWDEIDASDIYISFDCSYELSEVEETLSEEEFLSLKEDVLNSLKKIVSDKRGGMYLYSVSYADDCGQGDMEHEFMPSLNIVKESRSHH